MAYRAERRDAAQWRALIAEHARSSKTVERFCEDKGIGFSTFNRWRRKLGDAAPVEHSQHGTPSGFVEALSPESLSSTLRLIVSDSIQLELPANLSGERIAEIIHSVTARVEH